MNLKAFFPIIGSVLLVACGEPQGETSGSAGSGNGGSGNGGSGGSAATGGSPTTGSTSTGTATGKTVTIEMEPFEVASGAELYKCQNFANPFGGDAEVSAFESHMTAGSHHLLLFYRDVSEDGPLQDCSGLEFAATPYSTQLPDDSVAFPEGVAAAIPANKGLRLQTHYLNTSPDDFTAKVTMTFHIAESGKVEHHAGVMFIVQPSINVPPSSTKDIEYECNVPLDMSVIKAASHMHKHGKKFVSTVAGEPFYETDTWDEPKPALFDPPRQLKAGDPLHFTCTFENNGPTPLTFGESAESNEMCILGASYFPAPPGVPTIPCE